MGLFVPLQPDALAAAIWLGWVVAGVCFRQRDPLVFVAAVLVSTFLCGWALAVVATRDATHPALRATLSQLRGPGAVSDDAADPVILSGWLNEDVPTVGESVRLSLAVVDVAIDGVVNSSSGGVLLTVAGESTAAQTDTWRKGRLVRAPVLLRRPARYLNRGVPDHELALLRRGTVLVGTIKSALLVDLVRNGHWADERASALRAAARQIIEREIGRHSPRSAAIVRAILIGDRTALDDETEERLQAAGTYHVLAISGGNIAILAGLVLVVLRGLAMRAPAAEILACAILAAYAWLVGGGSSVNRATLMAITMLAAYAIDHRGHPYNAMSVAGGLGLVVNPMTLFDPGAWLTYGATLAIVAGAAAHKHWLVSQPRWLRAAAGLLLASISAELALFPVSAFVFSRVTAAGLLLNFAAIPLMTLVQVGAMVTLAAAVVGPAVAGAAGYLTHLCAWGLVENSRLVDVAPWLSVRLPAPNAWTLMAYYTGWLGMLLTQRHIRAVSGIVALGCGLWILVAPVPWWTFPREELRVVFLDVGQGDATLVRFPGGRSLLVDAGGAGGSRFDIGRRVVAPAVWAQGVRRLTYLLVTHGDADHMNGAPAVFRDLEPREVWEGVPVPPHEPLAALRRAAGAGGAAWRTLQRGDRLVVGPVEVRVWHPPLAEWERQRVRNDDSVVVEIRYGDVSIVLPGDVEAAGEAAIAPLLDAAPVRLFQAPHHGSGSSSSEILLRAANPTVVVVSVGRGNRFGHPHRAVLQRFGEAGSPVLRTDRDGAITLTTDGRDVVMSTFTGRTLTVRGAAR